VLEIVESFQKLVGKDRFPKLNFFAITMHSIFGNTYIRVWEHIFCEETSQI